jgi:hypothetical protein
MCCLILMTGCAAASLLANCPKPIARMSRPFRYGTIFTFHPPVFMPLKRHKKKSGSQKKHTKTWVTCRKKRRKYSRTYSSWKKTCLEIYFLSRNQASQMFCY